MLCWCLHGTPSLPLVMMTCRLYYSISHPGFETYWFLQLRHLQTEVAKFASARASAAKTANVSLKSAALSQRELFSFSSLQSKLTFVHLNRHGCIGYYLGINVALSTFARQRLKRISMIKIACEISGFWFCVFIVLSFSYSWFANIYMVGVLVVELGTLGQLYAYDFSAPTHSLLLSPSSYSRRSSSDIPPLHRSFTSLIRCKYCNCVYIPSSAFSSW